VIIVRLPFSLMTTFSRNVFSKTVAKLSRPFGRPRGLPDVPFLNLEYAGGFPYPTEVPTPCVGLLLFDKAHLFHLIEGASSFPVNRALASEGLPATDGNVHIDRVQFDSIADSADPLSCDNCRSATQERVENNVRTRCAVQNGVTHQSHRFNCGMQQRQIAFFSWSGERIHPRVLPDVGAVPSILTQLNIVTVYAELKNVCVWVKDTGGQGSLYRSQHGSVSSFCWICRAMPADVGVCGAAISGGICWPGFCASEGAGGGVT